MARDQGEALQILGRIDDGAQATGQRQRRTVRGRGQREFIAQQGRAAERMQRLGDALLVAQVRVECAALLRPPRRPRAVAVQAGQLAQVAEYTGGAARRRQSLQAILAHGLRHREADRARTLLAPRQTAVDERGESGQHIAQWTTISGTDAIGYNAQGRLASDCGPQVVAVGGCYTYQYDGNGNSTLGVNRDGHLNHGLYNSLNELVQGYTESYPATATVSYGYDAAGDTTAITTPVGLTNPTDPHALNTHFTYNPQGWLTAATYLSKGALVTLTQAYNAQGQRSRYSLSSNGAPALDTLFTYDSNGRVSQETVITNTATGPKLVFDNLYLYTQDGRPWMFLHTDPTTTPSTVPYGFVLDGQGNVVAVTDQGGAVVDRYAYNQWGRETGNDAADEEVPQQLRYRGLYYDEQPARYWMSDHRAYDPALERYLQPDANRSYVYADDNPTGACSLSGQCEILLHRDSVVPPIKLPCDVTLPIGPGLPVPLPTCGTYIAFYHLYLTVRQGQTVWIFQGNPSYYQEQKVFGKKVPLGGGLLIADGSSTKPLSKGINDDQYTNRGKQRTTVSHIPTNGRSCKQYVQRFGQIGDNVTSQLLYYAFYTNNSNSVAWTYLKYAGLYSPPLSVANYPGWGVDVSSGR